MQLTLPHDVKHLPDVLQAIVSLILTDLRWDTTGKSPSVSKIGETVEFTYWEHMKSISHSQNLRGSNKNHIANFLLVPGKRDERCKRPLENKKDYCRKCSIDEARNRRMFVIKATDQFSFQTEENQRRLAGKTLMYSQM